MSESAQLDQYCLNITKRDKNFVQNLYAELSKSENALVDNKKRSYRIRHVFYKSGWKPSWIKAKLVNLNDDIIVGKSTKEVVKSIYTIWIASMEMTGKLFADFTTLGLRGKAAKTCTYVLTPLINTSYSHPQMLQIGMEYICC